MPLKTCKHCGHRQEAEVTETEIVCEECGDRTVFHATDTA